MVSIMLLAASAAAATPSVEVAQANYTQCLSTAFDSAVNTRMSAADFMAGVTALCPRETAAFRAASVARKVAVDRASGTVKPDVSRAQAMQSFADTDAANRQAMLVNFGVDVQTSKKAPIQQISAPGR